MKVVKGRKDGFSSKLGIIAASAGSAIGLGIIWKFPYITGIYGGAAFILVYLVCVLLIGLPMMIAEFLIGRRGQGNGISSFKTLAPHTPWFLTGWIGVMASFIVLSYYGVVAGWTLHYVYTAVTNGFQGQTPDQLNMMFEALKTNSWKPIIWQVVFMTATGSVILGGVKDGIEKSAKILMPLLFVIILMLDICTLSLPNAHEGLQFLFKPDFSKINATAVMAALGNAFFSLSLGMAVMITFGSYMNKDVNIGKTAVQVIMADLILAIMAGLAIFPAVFAFNIEPNVGPGLVFVTLPNVFNQMSGGYYFGIFFFVLLTVAALTSSISLLEVIVAYFNDSLKWSRKKATLIVTIVVTIVGAIESLSYSTIDFKLPLFKGGERSILPFLDWMMEFTDLLLPIGGFFVSIFVGYVMLDKHVKKEITNNGKFKGRWYGLFRIVVKYVTPLAIFIMFINMVFGFF